MEEYEDDQLFNAPEEMQQYMSALEDGYESEALSHSLQEPEYDTLDDDSKKMISKNG